MTGGLCNQDVRGCSTIPIVQVFMMMLGVVIALGGRLEIVVISVGRNLRRCE